MTIRKIFVYFLCVSFLLMVNGFPRMVAEAGLTKEATEETKEFPWLWVGLGVLAAGLAGGGIYAAASGGDHHRIPVCP